MSILNRAMESKQKTNQMFRDAASREQSRNDTNKRIGDGNRNATIGNVASGAAIGTAIMPGAGTAVGAGLGLLVSLF